MTTQALDKPVTRAEAYELALVAGDLSSLTTEERLSYYRAVCESVGLNYLTRPLQYLKGQDGKLGLYANKDAAAQLRERRGVHIERIERETLGDLYIVAVYARDRDGRCDSDLGAVSIKGLSGEGLANAVLKAVTKAKRRVTLSLCGLGWLDESEVESIPAARVVDMDTGEVTSAPASARRLTEGEVIPPTRRKELMGRLNEITMRGLMTTRELRQEIRREYGRPVENLTDDELEKAIVRFELPSPDSDGVTGVNDAT